jgi:hypothetical protein
MEAASKAFAGNDVWVGAWVGEIEVAVAAAAPGWEVAVGAGCVLVDAGGDVGEGGGLSTPVVSPPAEVAVGAAAWESPPVPGWLALAVGEPSAGEGPMLGAGRVQLVSTSTIKMVIISKNFFMKSFSFRWPLLARLIRCNFYAVPFIPGISIILLALFFLCIQLPEENRRLPVGESNQFEREFG